MSTLNIYWDCVKYPWEISRSECSLSQLWRGHALPNLPEAGSDWYLVFLLNQLTDTFLVLNGVRLTETTPEYTANLTVKQVILSYQGWGRRNYISEAPNKGLCYYMDIRPIPVVSLDRTSSQSGFISWSLWLTKNPRQYHPFHNSWGRPLYMKVCSDDVLRSQEKHEEEGQIWCCVADKLDKGFLDE